MSTVTELIPIAKKIEHHKIKEGTRLISNGAFKECFNLKEIEFPSSLNFIGEDAFRECGKLETVTLPSSLLYIGRNAFYCKYKKNHLKINIPSSVKIIEGNPFNNKTIIKCDNTNFKVVDNVLYSADGKVLISYCSPKEEFFVPNGVVTIGEKAFREAPIKIIHLPESLEIIDKCAFEHATKLEQVFFSNGLKEIRFKAFEWCDNLKAISLPQNIERIDSQAFNFNWYLKLIKIPKGTLEHYRKILPNIMYNQIYDDEYIYENGLFLNYDRSEVIAATHTTTDNYIIPEGVLKIRNYAFEDIYYIDTIQLPRTLKYISHKAFPSEIGIDKIIVPQGEKRYFSKRLQLFKDIIIESEQNDKFRR